MRWFAQRVLCSAGLLSSACAASEAERAPVEAPARSSARMAVPEVEGLEIRTEPAIASLPPAPREPSPLDDAPHLDEAAHLTQTPLRLRFVGDVIFARYRDGRLSRVAPEGAPVFNAVAPLLDGDWVVANLETPLLDEVPARDGRPGYFFAATKQMARSLVGGGFDAVSLGNNHASDLGVRGLLRTPEILSELGITPIGAGRLPREPLTIDRIEVRGTTLGVVSVTTQLNFQMPDDAPAVHFIPTKDLAEELQPLLAEARRAHDLVIVLVHWGVEYSRYPETVQRHAARALIESGADLVIGHHPHVLQEIELYRGGAIAYSLGNFLFGNLAPDPRLTGVLGVDVHRAPPCRLEIRFQPAVMRAHPHIHPAPARGATAERVRRRLLPLANDQRGRWSRAGEALIAEQRMHDCEARR